MIEIVAWFLVMGWLLSGFVAGIVYAAMDDVEGCSSELFIVISGALAGPAFWLLTAAAYTRSRENRRSTVEVETQTASMATMLAECRTLAAVVADANSVAPGRREVARELMHKIDSLLAREGIYYVLLQDGDPEAVTFSREDAEAWKAEEVIDEDGFGERDYCSVKGWKALWMEVGDDV